MPYTQSPTEKLDYEVHLAGGDSIVSVQWTSTPQLTLSVQSTTETTTKCRVSGVQVGKTYIVNAHIVGLSGQEYDAYIRIIGGTTGR